MRLKTVLITLLAIAATAAVPLVSLAANTATTGTSAKSAPFLYAAWLPFWQGQSGAQDIAIHLDSLNEVSPFSYELGPNGGLEDDLQINTGAWDGWFSAIHDLGIKNIPTIAWFDTNNIYNLLSNAKKRQAEEDMLTSLVKTKGFDGIDIDFESMSSATRPYFSIFLQGLAIRLHPQKKILTCEATPRTPPDELYDGPPTGTYAQDYSAMGQYCDEVRVMAYDQGTIDMALNATKGNGMLYAPVADPDWVQRVLSQTLPYINAKKIMLGIPTYGYEYEVNYDVAVTNYQRVRSFTYQQAMDRLDSLGMTATRNNAEELSFTYTSSTYIQVPSILQSTVPSAQPLALMGPVNPAASTTFFVSFPDATSAAAEITLAKKDGLRGVIIFKADGQQDPALWNDFK